MNLEYSWIQNGDIDNPFPKNIAKMTSVEGPFWVLILDMFAGYFFP